MDISRAGLFKQFSVRPLWVKIDRVRGMGDNVIQVYLIFLLDNICRGEQKCFVMPLIHFINYHNSWDGQGQGCTAPGPPTLKKRTFFLMPITLFKYADFQQINSSDTRWGMSQTFNIQSSSCTT